MKIFSSSFILLVCTVVALASFIQANTWNGIKVGLQPVPYEHFCQHKLDMVDYQFVKRYAHNLLQFRTGVKFAQALQNCKHHEEHQEIRCGDDANTRQTVLELI
jgi:hypothetical protein